MAWAPSSSGLGARGRVSRNSAAFASLTAALGGKEAPARTDGPGPALAARLGAVSLSEPGPQRKAAPRRQQPRRLTPDELEELLAGLDSQSFHVDDLSARICGMDADWGPVVEETLVPWTLQKGELLLELMESVAVRLISDSDFQAATHDALLAAVASAMAPKESEEVEENEDAEKESEEKEEEDLWSDMELRNLGILSGRLLEFGYNEYFHTF